MLDNRIKPTLDDYHSNQVCPNPFLSPKPVDRLVPREKRNLKKPENTLLWVIKIHCIIRSSQKSVKGERKGCQYFSFTGEKKGLVWVSGLARPSVRDKIRPRSSVSWPHVWHSVCMTTLVFMCGDLFECHVKTLHHKVGLKLQKTIQLLIFYLSLVPNLSFFHVLYYFLSRHIGFWKLIYFLSHQARIMKDVILRMGSGSMIFRSESATWLGQRGMG